MDWARFWFSVARFLRGLTGEHPQGILDTRCPDCYEWDAYIVGHHRECPRYKRQETGEP